MCQRANTEVRGARLKKTTMKGGKKKAVGSGMGNCAKTNLLAGGGLWKRSGLEILRFARPPSFAAALAGGGVAAGTASVAMMADILQGGWVLFLREIRPLRPVNR